MRGDVRAGDAAAQPPREDDLDAQLVDGLVAAGAPRRGVGALAAEERALPADGPRAVLVLADHAGAGGEQRLAHEVGVVGRHEPDELEHVGGGRGQRHDGLQIEQLRDHVGHAAAGLVEAGVRRDDGHALARGAQRQTAGLGVVREPLERVEDERVVADDDPGAEAVSLVQDGVVHLERDEDDRRARPPCRSPPHGSSSPAAPTWRPTWSHGSASANGARLSTAAMTSRTCMGQILPQPRRATAYTLAAWIDQADTHRTRAPPSTPGSSSSRSRPASPSRSPTRRS